MSTNQDGQGRDRAPRRTTRRSTATPVRDVSPTARSTRAGSTALQNTPVTRRSARAPLRRADQPRDAVNNSVLPEIQTSQSYAYGSSKTPLLPEQLHVRDTMTMRQVANEMETAINRAGPTVDSQLDTIEADKNQTQRQTANQRVTRRSSKEPSPPASVTTDLQKKQRTAAWASSLENDELGDIEEEDSHVDSPDTKRTEPSSFPSGIFDQSYQYERGLRPPRRPPSPPKVSMGSRLGAALGTLFDYLISASHRMQQFLITNANILGRWLTRLFKSMSNSIFDFPESWLFSSIVKTFLVVILTATMSYALCFVYSRFLCDHLSTSKVSQTIESICGTCQAGQKYINLNTSSEADVRQLTSALKHIDTQIRSIESRLNSRLDSKVSAIHTDIDDLRREQSNLIEEMESVSRRASQQGSFKDPASTLIPMINYFSPANGAIINVPITSPTRQAPIALPLRILARMLGVTKYRAHTPVVALEPWHDVGDCWCAAASIPGQDSVRLGVGVREYIFPTELIIEHPPKEVTLTPETAPRLVELWADLGHLDPTQTQDLAIDTTMKDSEANSNPFGTNWALISTMEYNINSHTGHVQRFALDVNQHNDLKYAALDFALRVRSTWGGEYGCLYRVRLHGVPVEKMKDSPGSGSDTDESDERGIGSDEVLY